MQPSKLQIKGWLDTIVHSFQDTFYCFLDATDDGKYFAYACINTDTGPVTVRATLPVCKYDELLLSIEQQLVVLTSNEE